MPYMRVRKRRMRKEKGSQCTHTYTRTHVHNTSEMSRKGIACRINRRTTKSSSAPRLFSHQIWIHGYSHDDGAPTAVCVCVYICSSCLLSYSFRSLSLFLCSLLHLFLNPLGVAGPHAHCCSRTALTRHRRLLRRRPASVSECRKTVYTAHHSSIN